MGIAVEFNPDLALRDISEYKEGRRKLEECIPEKLEIGKIYDFFKKEQRIYYLKGEISLIETTSDGGNFSKSRANVNILEVMHFVENGEVCTRGKYKVMEVFNISKDALFEKCSMVK
ncbi:MAG: hypothetical protein ACD_56C00015G0003 [uncultured bacterium]|nr:MAG: hypothetical protein ACD_56C00015G0003 [uncultured bacterium]